MSKHKNEKQNDVQWYEKDPSEMTEEEMELETCYELLRDCGVPFFDGEPIGIGD